MKLTRSIFFFRTLISSDLLAALVQGQFHGSLVTRHAVGHAGHIIGTFAATERILKTCACIRVFQALLPNFD